MVRVKKEDNLWGHQLEEPRQDRKRLTSRTAWRLQETGLYVGSGDKDVPWFLYEVFDLSIVESWEKKMNNLILKEKEGRKKFESVGHNGRVGCYLWVWDYPDMIMNC